MKFNAKQTLLSVLICMVLILSNTLPTNAERFDTSPEKGNQLVAESRQTEIQTVIDAGFDYITLQMNDDGGVRWMDEGSNVPSTIRLVLALGAVNYPPDHILSSTGLPPIDFLKEQASAWVNQTGTDQPGFSTARAGQLLTAIAASNEDPNNFGSEGLDLIYAIKSHYDPNSGVFGNATPENVLDQVWAILGLAANYASIPEESITLLLSAQLEDGSWNDGFESFLDTTPLAIMAIMASGWRDADIVEIQSAVAFMKANQQPNGGWQTTWDTTTNANTTGMMLQAISALRQDPTSETWQTEAGDPVSALLALQQENGAIGGDFANTYSTADAILGLSQQPLFELGTLQGLGRGFDYLLAVQEEDGGWGTVGMTIDVIFALRAAGWDPNTVKKNGAGPLEFIAENLEVFLDAGPDAFGKAILGLTIAGGNPTNFSGINLVERLLETYDPQNSAFGTPDNTWHQALAILGLTAAEVQLPDGVVETIVGLQKEDGGWEYSPGFGTSPDNTSLAVQALLAAKWSSESDVIQDALAFIQSRQVGDGGWGDSSTTAYALMALNALGIDPKDFKSEDGKTPLHNLFSYQKASGAFMFSSEAPDDNLMATSSALLAGLSGDYLLRSPKAEGKNYAGLVVHPGDDAVEFACVEFEKDSISGLDLLDDSGFPYETQEGFMNSILGISNPSGETMYWSYWHWDGREWIFNNTGAGESQVLPGTIEAWHFTSWEIFPSLPPDFVPHLNEICHETILKNYATQPYIHFKDLQPPSLSDEVEAEPVNGELEEEPTQVVEDTPTRTETLQHGETNTQTTTQEVPQERTPYRSPLPIIIIGFVGLAALILILIIILKRPE